MRSIEKNAFFIALHILLGGRNLPAGRSHSYPALLYSRSSLSCSSATILHCAPSPGIQVCTPARFSPSSLHILTSLSVRLYHKYITRTVFAAPSEMTSHRYKTDGARHNYDSSHNPIMHRSLLFLPLPALHGTRRSGISRSRTSSSGRALVVSPFCRTLGSSHSAHTTRDSSS